MTNLGFTPARAAGRSGAKQPEPGGIDGGGGSLGRRETTVFRLDPSRSARVPRAYLHLEEDESPRSIEPRKTLITDNYVVYRILGADIRNAWCWAHIRRKFGEAARRIVNRSRVFSHVASPSSDRLAWLDDALESNRVRLGPHLWRTVRAIRVTGAMPFPSPRVRGIVHPAIEGPAHHPAIFAHQAA